MVNSVFLMTAGSCDVEFYDYVANSAELVSAKQVVCAPGSCRADYKLDFHRTKLSTSSAELAAHCCVGASIADALVRAPSLGQQVRVSSSDDWPRQPSLLAAKTGPSQLEIELSLGCINYCGVVGN